LYQWLVQEMAKLPEPAVAGDIKEMEFDELWQLISSKKITSGLSRRWMVAEGELLPRWSAIATPVITSDA
jgi:hypothetical protein